MRSRAKEFHGFVVYHKVGSMFTWIGCVSCPAEWKVENGPLADLLDELLDHSPAHTCPGTGAPAMEDRVVGGLPDA